MPLGSPADRWQYFQSVPAPLKRYLGQLEDFIEKEIVPLQHSGDNNRFFDHRREFARTDAANGGVPAKEWDELLRQCRIKADAAGHFRYGLPKEFGGGGGSNYDMAVIREFFACRGLGLHNDLQNEHSIVGNVPQVMMMNDFGTPEQKKEWLPEMLAGRRNFAFALTEPSHGSDATWMETTARKVDGGWVINGTKMWNSGVHIVSHDLVFARTHGKAGDAVGITAFLVGCNPPQAGFKVEEYYWTFNMPTDHARVSLRDVRVPDSAVLGKVGYGLAVAQHFVHENRIRQAASSLGAAQYCVDQSVLYASVRAPFGKKLNANQAIQFPLVELQTECEMLRLLIRSTAAAMDGMRRVDIPDSWVSAKVSMCNYRANRLCCEAADRAIQVHGGMGYSRHLPFEHIYRHHRRYRITEGSEEIQMRKVAGFLFAFQGPRREAKKRAAKL
eukprot:TRINITY_DN12739_c0_g1_i1.p1 TRINITY_DN12739_c0_g1~~TRINITY_DN12739_c0_g1_i1.p1  ORF type:complete len:471 (+),score=176.01 TRINITY_DN12739_c0_g1_i1:82-1413(+)